MLIFGRSARAVENHGRLWGRFVLRNHPHYCADTLGEPRPASCDCLLEQYICPKPGSPRFSFSHTHHHQRVLLPLTSLYPRYLNYATRAVETSLTHRVPTSRRAIAYMWDLWHALVIELLFLRGTGMALSVPLAEILLGAKEVRQRSFRPNEAPTLSLQRHKGGTRAGKARRQLEASIHIECPKVAVSVTGWSVSIMKKSQCCVSKCHQAERAWTFALEHCSARQPCPDRGLVCPPHALEIVTAGEREAWTVIAVEVRDSCGRCCG